jgi:hypothetical protein
MSQPPQSWRGKLGAMAALTGLAAAGCGSGSSQPSASSSSHIVGNPAPSGSPAVPAVKGPTGPFRIKVLTCGKYSRAQRAHFGYTGIGYSSAYGLIFRYTNVSESVTGYPDLTVNFTRGSTVVGSNQNASEPSVRPGQSATADVPALRSDGSSWLKFIGCDPTSYAVDGPSGIQSGVYLP